jgi:hypothetical protein
MRFMTSDEDFSREVSVPITLGHVLLAWEVMSSKFSDLRSNESLSEEERRAIWGLADLLEKVLVEHGITGRPQAEWETLISKANAYIQTVPVDFLD